MLTAKPLRKHAHLSRLSQAPRIFAPDLLLSLTILSSLQLAVERKTSKVQVYEQPPAIFLGSKQYPTCWNRYKKRQGGGFAINLQHEGIESCEKEEPVPIMQRPASLFAFRARSLALVAPNFWVSK